MSISATGLVHLKKFSHSNFSCRCTLTSLILNIADCSCFELVREQLVWAGFRRPSRHSLINQISLGL